RYNRLMGRDSFFLTGTDEHGQKVDEAARELDRTPIEHCDITVLRFKELWEKLEITNDHFIRTTEKGHIEVVQEILQDLMDRELIYKGAYEGWYCVPCERFFTEKDLVDEKCPECQREVKKIEEPNYFFKMGQYQDWLIEYIQTHPGFVQPESRSNEVLGFLKKGPLGDLCISRPKERLAWGIELPFDPDYVCYVWFDALLNYITGIGYRRDESAFLKWWPATYNLIGKDILTTHAVYWPIMLKAMGIDPPQTVFAHGWWLTRDSKMSKSRGNIVNPMDMIDAYGVDSFRYFLIAEMKLGKDCNFTEEGFVGKYNAELANDLGNLLSRVVTMIRKNCDGIIPAPGEPGVKEAALEAAAADTVAFAEDAVLSLNLDRMTARIFELVRLVNKYFDENAPWKMLKEGDRPGLERVLYHASEALRIIAGLLQPVMPAKMEALRCTLGLAAGVPDIALLRKWGSLEPGAALGEITQLFPRIETSPAEAAAAEEKEEDRMSHKDFQKIDLKTARVIACEKVPKSDKLLKLEIDLGSEQRTIVAGIAQQYKPDDMIGRTIIVVANLEKAKLFGIESNGMLLAAHGEEGLRLLTTDEETSPGASVS
ncbi:methionine--tRNA ligase, partial [Planctomycetota bacterium]